jgi:type IV secretory pathway VirB4 component
MGEALRGHPKEIKPPLLDPLNQPHTLIAGITGSGKSVLMQNLI